MVKPRILILGKLPPPYMGPAIATQIILGSSLNRSYTLLHLNTKANDSLHSIGKWSLRKVLRNILLYARLLKLILVFRPKLVLIPISQSTTGFLKDFFFIAIAKLSLRKVIVQLRGSDFRNWLLRSSWLVRKWVPATLRRTQGVIVLGENLRPLFEGIIPSERIFVVPNGGNYPLSFSPKKHSELKILYLANLQSSKGIEDLIWAVSILKTRNITGFRLDVAGEWREAETKLSCLETVQKYDLPVHFHPAADEQAKYTLLSGADIFVFTPRAPEGHPWVIVEAMAAGLPIISTDRGAIIESVLDGVNGYIVGVQRPDEIADKLQLLIADHALRERMGKAGRQLYEEQFTEEKMVERLRAVFEEVMGKE